MLSCAGAWPPGGYAKSFAPSLTFFGFLSSPSLLAEPARDMAARPLPPNGPSEMVNQSHFFSPQYTEKGGPGLACLHRREELLRRDAPAGGLAAALAIIGVKAS